MVIGMRDWDPGHHQNVACHPHMVQVPGEILYEDFSQATLSDAV